MAAYHLCLLHKICRMGFMALLVGSLLGVCSDLWAQNGVLAHANNVNNVGGIAINAEGLLKNATLDAQGKLNRLRNVPAELAKNAALRKVSLRGLQLALQECLKNGRAAPRKSSSWAACSRSATCSSIPSKKTSCWSGRAKAGRTMAAATWWAQSPAGP